MATNMDNEKVVFAFDVESTAPYEPGKVLSIGICVGTYNTKTFKWQVQEKSTYNLELPEHTLRHDDLFTDRIYDPSTLEFWRKNKIAWKTTREYTVPEKEACVEIIKTLSRWQEHAAKTGKDFVLVTDNAWYDNLWLSTLLTRHGGNVLRHDYKGKYIESQRAVDLTQQINALEQVHIHIHANFKATVTHDHTPANDAQFNFELYVHMEQMLHSVRPLIRFQDPLEASARAL